LPGPHEEDKQRDARRRPRGVARGSRRAPPMAVGLCSRTTRQRIGGSTRELLVGVATVLVRYWGGVVGLGPKKPRIGKLFPLRFFFLIRTTQTNSFPRNDT